MKTSRSMAIALGVVTLAAAWLVFESHAQNKPAADRLSPADKVEAKLLSEWTQHSLRLEKMYKDSEKSFNWALTLHLKQEELMEKQLRAQARYERILDTWEEHQKQYQRYLDGLPKK